MGIKRLGRTVYVGFCVLTLFSFSGRSFSAEEVISVLPEPDNPLVNGDAVSPGWDPGVFAISESANPLGTASDRTFEPYGLPPLDFMVLYINGRQCGESTHADTVELLRGWPLEIEFVYSFQDVWGNDIPVDRFFVVKTPKGRVHSILKDPQFRLVDGLYGDPYLLEAGMVTDTLLKLKDTQNFLELGTYVFFAGFDANPNGKPDYDSLKYMCAFLVVEPSMSVHLTADPLFGTAPLEVTFHTDLSDRYGVMDTCKLVVEDQKYDCAVLQKHTFKSADSYMAWVDVTDKHGGQVSSNIVTITVEPANEPVNKPPTIYNLSVTPNEVYADEVFTIQFYYDDPDGKDDVKIHHIDVAPSSLDIPSEGSGLFSKNFYFLEEAKTGTYVVNVYSIDSAGNRSNTLSGSISYVDAKKCGTFTQAGGDTPETHIVEMGWNKGWFFFDYNTMTIKDRIFIYYEDALIFDSGCVGTQGDWATHEHYEGTSTQIKVHVEPNCPSGTGTGTKWNFTVRCPTSGPY